MAQTILGLDIGSYSVKVATLQASFRSLSLTTVEEFIIPHAGRSRPERSAAEVLERVALRAKEKDAVVVTALPGDRVMTRFVDLPFDDPKRIESVLGFELEGLIPLTVGDMVYAYQPNGREESGDYQVFAAATQPDTIANYLESLSDAGLDPRDDPTLKRWDRRGCLVKLPSEQNSVKPLTHYSTVLGIPQFLRVSCGSCGVADSYLPLCGYARDQAGCSWLLWSAQ